MKLPKPASCLTPLWACCIIFALLCSGCLTGGRPVLLNTSGPGWEVQEGTALWQPKRDMAPLAGEIVIASHAGGLASVEFSKSPFSLVQAQTTRTNWYIHFPPRGISVEGRHAPPVRFAWLYLQAALAGQSLPPTLHFERRADGSWRLENQHSGETVEGFLTRKD